MDDLISRQAAIEALHTRFKDGFNEDKWWNSTHVLAAIEGLPPAQPETAKRIVGKSKDGKTLWYQCDMCNEPVDEQDNYCRGCGRRLIDG